MLQLGKGLANNKKFYDKFPSQYNDIPQNCSSSWYPVAGLTIAEINLDICTIRLQLAQILGGDLGPDLLHCAGQERDRGGANQPQAAPGLHRGGSLNHHVPCQSCIKGLKKPPK